MKLTSIVLFYLFLGSFTKSLTSAELKFVKELKFTKDNLSGGSAIISFGTSIFIALDNSNVIYQLNSETLNFEQEYTTFKFEEKFLINSKLEKIREKPDIEAGNIIQVRLKNNGLKKFLIVTPSGSTESRVVGALLPLEQKNEPIILDYSKLYKKLDKSILNLNIEGVLQIKNEIIFLQRGNSEISSNALIKADSHCLFPTLKFPDRNPKFIQLSENCSIRIIPIDLSKVDGSNVKLKFTFSDAISDKDMNILFLATAEDTITHTEDGEISGTIIGKMNAEGKVYWTKLISKKLKLEGITKWNTKKNKEIYLLISDQDKKDEASRIYQLILK